MSDTLNDHDGLVEHYLREREFLRKEGTDFAKRYGKVAGRLRLGDEEHPDPHVERLRQSFAFLTGRIQRKLDDEFPEVAQGLLSVLFPQLTSPVPSMAVVEAELDHAQSLPSSGVRVPRGTLFQSRPVRGEPLRFRCGMDTTLWPLRIADAHLAPPEDVELAADPTLRAVLVLNIDVQGEFALGDLELNHLRLHLRGEGRAAYVLYETLSTALRGVVLRGDADHPSLKCPASALRPIGFGEDEALLEYPRRSFAGYRLLQEYFAFPARFLFFDLDGLAATRGWGTRRLEVRLLLNRNPGLPSGAIGPAEFGLSCLPLINLFEARADPIVLDARRSEFDVVPDAHRPLDLEVFSVRRVEGVSAGTGERVRYEPFYSLSHADGESGPRAYWHARRQPSLRKGDEGTELKLALVDLGLAGTAPGDQTLNIDLLCTNRDLPVQVRQWGRTDDFRAQGVNGIAGVRCIHGPSPPQRLDLRGPAYWRLVSHLSLNHLSLVSEGRDALREILRVYDFGRSRTHREEIEGIADVRSRPVMRWIRGAGGAGYCRGTEVTLLLDRKPFVGAGAFLFAAVLERFLGLYSSLHSFSELALETVQDEGLVHRWPPRTGDKTLL